MLFKNGSTTKIAAKVSYDPSTRTAKLNPTNNLQRGVTYRAVLTTGAKDVAGISLVQQKEWLFTVKRLSAQRIAVEFHIGRAGVLVYGAPALSLLTLIHPSDWKVYFRKFVSRILHSPVA